MLWHLAEWSSGSLQTHHFFLERDPGGSWRWHWWLRVPGQRQGGPADGSQPQVPDGSVGSGGAAAAELAPSVEGQPCSRPFSKSVWSAMLQVAFGEARPLPLSYNPGPLPRSLPSGGRNLTLRRTPPAVNGAVATSFFTFIIIIIIYKSYNPIPLPLFLNSL